MTLDPALLAVLATLLVDIVAKLRAKKSDDKNSAATTEAVRELKQVVTEIRDMQRLTMQQLEQHEGRIRFLEATQERAHGLRH